MKTQHIRNNHESIFALSSLIRYVAFYQGGTLELAERDNIASASSSESDQYEELLVNPTLLTLVRQRGNIDCGGAEFILVGYGNFLQLVIAVGDGHISVAFERAANPLDFVAAIKRAMGQGM